MYVYPLYTKEIEKSLKERFPHCSIACSSDILIEIMNEGVTKADAIHPGFGFLSENMVKNISSTIGGCSTELVLLQHLQEQ